MARVQQLRATAPTTKTPAPVEERGPLPWNPKQRKVLAYAFEGRYTQRKISELTGVPISTVKSWLRHPEFRIYLDRLREDLVSSFDELRIAYTRVEHRVIALSRMAESARLEFEENPTFTEKRFVGIDRKTGKPIIIENTVFNSEAHKAFRDTLGDIAKELGHRKTAVEVTGKDGKPLFDTDAIAAETDQRFASFLARANQARVLGIVDSEPEDRTSIPMGVLGEAESTGSEGD